MDGGFSAGELFTGTLATFDAYAAYAWYRFAMRHSRTDLLKSIRVVAPDSDSPPRVLRVRSGVEFVHVEGGVRATFDIPKVAMQTALPGQGVPFGSLYDSNRHLFDVAMYYSPLAAYTSVAIAYSALVLTLLTMIAFWEERQPPDKWMVVGIGVMSGLLFSNLWLRLHCHRILSKFGIRGGAELLHL